jgi:TetR/AcrR family transcriptional repressor of mexAB-oprM operon
MARRTKEDAEKTRESLLDAAEKVFLRRGVTSSTLDEIAREAGVTRGAVYWHFDNKRAIFQAMHDRVKQPLDMVFAELTGGDDPLQGLKQMCIHVFEILEQDEHARNVFTILRTRWEDYHCENSDQCLDMQQKQKEVLAKFARVFTQSAKRYPLVDGVTPEFAALSLHAFISGVFWDYLRSPGNFPLTQLAPQLVECFFRGILK